MRCRPPQPSDPRETQSNNTPTPTRGQHQDAHTFHVEQAAKQTSHSIANIYPTKETRIFTTEETQLNKEHSAKTCSTKKKIRSMIGSTARHASKQRSAPAEKRRKERRVPRGTLTHPTHTSLHQPTYYDPERATPSRAILLRHRPRDPRGATASSRSHPEIQYPTPRPTQRSQRDYPLAPRHNG